ncbi:energy transducer TonB [Hymenobacter antarcticus]|uniref:TonB C-terminal domain-containing protein n=1 Tax=Hymenobacter antarcticus TaxID=486270 RepID=A0ABP7P0X8_9BACT
MSPADSPFAQLPAPGPHPATAELRAYAAGRLGPEDEHRIEAHTLDCERCADVVAGFAMTDPATTDQAVADLRTRLQARVGPAEPVPVAGGWAWPRIAAAAALLGAVASGIWSWEHYAPAPSTARLETTSPVAPAPSTIPSGSPTPAQIPEIAAAEVPAATAVPQATDALVASTTPASARPADYAAVMQAPVPRRRALGRVARPAAQPATEPADRFGFSNQESEMAANEAAAEAADMPVPTAAPTAASSAAGVALQSAPALVEPTAADTLAHDNAVRLSRQFAQAKSGINNLAADNAARVAATPMPTAPAINPAPVGGTPAFREYLRREAAGFEPEDGASRLSGLVRLQFTVGADGKVSTLKVLRGLRADYDAEALRMVCEGPAWQPGIASGRRAPLPVEITVPF